MNKLLWLGVVAVVVVVAQMCAVEALTFKYEFYYADSFPKNPQPGEFVITIGAEGMCVMNGPGGIPRLFVLSHSMKYQVGAIHELRLTPEFIVNVTGSIISTIPLDNTTIIDIGADFTGLTVNLEGNLAILGRYIDDTGTEVPVMFTIDPNTGNRIGGPTTIPPPVYMPTDISYDPNTKDYWVVDRETNSLYHLVQTCCDQQLQQLNAFPYRKWQNQLRMKRIYGLEYGLQGYDNIFQKKKRDVDVANSAITQEGQTLRYISIPAFGDPEGVDVDPVTGHIWVLNDAPTTVLYELTTDGVVVNLWQIEQLTGGYQDGNSVAATTDWVLVGFDNERKIVVFTKEDPAPPVQQF